MRKIILTLILIFIFVANSYAINNALQFDGEGDYLVVPDSDDWDISGSDSDSWTIDFWVKHAGDVEFQGYIVHFQSKGYALENHWSITHVGMPSGYPGLQFMVYRDDKSIVDTGRIAEGYITDADWHHIALCKVGNEYGFYKDGAQIGYAQSNETYTYIGSLYIGSNGGPDGGAEGFFNGYMDEFRIAHSNLFNADPNAISSDTIIVPSVYGTGDEPGLVAYWNFDEGNGQTVYDISNNGHNAAIYGNPQWVVSDVPIQPNAIPEPTTIFLFGIGSLAAFLTKRKS